VYNSPVFSARKVHHTYADYVQLEADSLVKHEYCDGEIYAMAGGTPEHGALAMALAAQLREQLPAECHLLSSDVKVRIAASDLSTHPDLSVVCGPLLRDTVDANAIVNPIVLVEVTSPSSKDYDRGEKLSHYKQIASLQTVLIVAHDVERITCVQRSESEWTISEYRAGEIANAVRPALRIDVRQVYDVLRSLLPR
jgi:Uma2 family endonuclease